MTTTEGGVSLDCCVSPNQEVFQNWNSKTCGPTGWMDFSRADWGLLNTGWTSGTHKQCPGASLGLQHRQITKAVAQASELLWVSWKESGWPVTAASHGLKCQGFWKSGLWCISKAACEASGLMGVIKDVCCVQHWINEGVQGQLCNLCFNPTLWKLISNQSNTKTTC